MKSVAPGSPLPNSDAQILSLRGPRHPVDADKPYALVVEPERTIDGTIEDVATVFITNKECPFRCLMCDLWKNTTTDRTPTGKVADQIRWALERLSKASNIKLYNSGNFFDDQAISPADRDDIVEMLGGFNTVIVECHPKLVDPRTIAFASAIEGRLQVAMGLETVDPRVLPILNKRMTLKDFEKATKYLLDHGVAVRAFVLLRTPYQSEEEGVQWAKRSIEFAFSIGVECCAVVPVRAGNGVMDELQRQGHFAPPSLRSIETVLDYGIALGNGRVFMDLWDLETFHDCKDCIDQRKQRLCNSNLSQDFLPHVTCPCEGQ